MSFIDFLRVDFSVAGIENDSFPFDTVSDANRLEDHTPIRGSHAYLIIGPKVTDS